MNNPAFVLPDAMKGIGAIFKAVDRGGISHGVTNLFNRLNAAIKEPAGTSCT
jgi:hypothetical protein